MGLEDSVFNVKYFGALGDGVADDFPAFQRALAAIDALTGKPPGEDQRGAILWIPFGLYRLGQPLRITRPLIIQGVGRLNTELRFFRQSGGPPDLPLAGIVVERELINPDNPNGPFRALADGAVIRDLRVSTDASFSPPSNGPSTAVQDDDDFVDPGTNSGILRTSSGIVLFATQARIDNCYVNGFEHDGIHINSRVEPGSLAHSWHIENCFVGANGRHGLFVIGQANAGCAINLTCNGNFKWGIYDHSFLGNTYVMCHVESNGHINHGPNDPLGSFGGGYRAVSGDAFSLFLGCYSEADQKNILKFPNAAIGGNVATGWEDDPSPKAITYLLRKGQLQVDALSVQGSIATNTRLIKTIASGAPQPITAEDNVVLLEPTVGDVPLTLPSFAGSNLDGLHLTVKKIDAGDKKVIIQSATAGESIDGADKIELSQQFSWVTLLAVAPPGSGAQPAWYVIGRG